MPTQCVQIAPTMIVPKPPNSKPAFLNANGMAKIPEPRELFRRCANAPIVLILNGNFSEISLVFKIYYLFYNREKNGYQSISIILNHDPSHTLQAVQFYKNCY